MSHGAIAEFPPPKPDPAEQRRYRRIRGKLSRLLARNIVTKKLTMTNIRPLVTFTFDDAPESACVTGGLLLEQHQARGTYYISGGGCGALGWNGRVATAEQLKALCLKGHEIGCHTYSHAVVGNVDHDALVAELDRNRSFLQAIHRDVVVRNFAYPYGVLSFGAKRYLEARFDSCRSLHAGVNAITVDLGALKVCELHDATMSRRRILDIIAEAVNRNGWLVFATHDVKDEPTCFGASPGLLAFALNAARAAGCLPVTVREALRILNGADAFGDTDSRAAAMPGPRC